MTADVIFERLMMRKPDADDLKRCPEALRVVEATDLDVVWPMTREGIEELRDLCNEALAEDEAA